MSLRASMKNSEMLKILVMRKRKDVRGQHNFTTEDSSAIDTITTDPIKHRLHTELPGCFVSFLSPGNNAIVSEKSCRASWLLSKFGTLWTMLPVKHGTQQLL